MGMFNKFRDLIGIEEFDEDDEEFEDDEEGEGEDDE